VLHAYEPVIALIDARLCNMLVRVDHGESGQPWRLKGVFDGSNRHMVKGDVPAMTEDLNQLGQLILHGTDDRAGWSEVYDLIEQRRLVES
jgi:hypothetical protein